MIGGRVTRGHNGSHISHHTSATLLILLFHTIASTATIRHMILVQTMYKTDPVFHARIVKLKRYHIMIRAEI